MRDLCLSALALANESPVSKSKQLREEFPHKIFRQLVQVTVNTCDSFAALSPFLHKVFRQIGTGESSQPQHQIALELDPSEPHDEPLDSPPACHISQRM